MAKIRLVRFVFAWDLPAVRIIRVPVIAGCPQGESGLYLTITQSLTHSLTHCARISQIALSIDQSVPTKPTHFCCGEVFCQRWYSIFNGKCQNYDSIGSVGL